MYMLTKAERTVRVPPSELGRDIADAIDGLTWEAYEGKGHDRAVTVLIRNVEPVGPGRIVHGDGAVYQTVKFDQLVFKPRENEIIDGTVVEIVRFGAFVRIGPMDALLHVSQVMDDHVDVDAENQRLIGKETNKTLSVGDRVRVRIVSIDFNDNNPLDSKIGLTMRQPGLGRIEWIEEENRKEGEAQ
ncbi:MAG: DNA-directed RNA polymerase [Thermoplasmatales archaeon]|nr:DNA-directed RNA polymerase [Thermoplasmatales archaeon]